MFHLLGRLNSLVERVILPVSIAGLVLGLGAAAFGRHDLANLAWSIPAIIIGIWLTAAIIRDLFAREAGVDVIAVLAIVGALAFGETLAAAVIGRRSRSKNCDCARELESRGAPPPPPPPP